jgi:glycosyltransferase involved in cell wall biosynthesis
MGKGNGKMEKPLVSIIIPFYNYGKYIGDCLKSVWNGADDLPIQCIVVDDCSAPVHSVKAKDACMQYPGTAYVKLDENMGVAAARNMGIRMSSGEYITCLDADDMLVPGGLRARVRKLHINEDCSMVHGVAYKINEERANSEWSYEQCMAGIKHLQVYSRWLNTQTILWRRDVFEKYGLYYEKLRSKEDKEFIVRLGIHPDFKRLKKLILFTKTNTPVAIYRRHEGAKHRRRIEDRAWYNATEDEFNHRVSQVRQEGITQENTPWL